MQIDRTRPLSTGNVVSARSAEAATGADGAQDAGATTPARAAGDVATIASFSGAELIPKVRQALDMLMQEVQRMREELSRTRHRISCLEKLADDDTLVPVANRRAFARTMGRMVAYAERYGANTSVLYFDINGFKEINDRHGHAAGDVALRHVAMLLAENIRESDIVGRLGGDEFGVILVQADGDAAHEKEISLSDLIENTPFNWEGNALTLSVAFGTYFFSGREDAGEAPQRADRAMYAQKQGRAAG